jgi:hypothetical protein
MTSYAGFAWLSWLLLLLVGFFYVATELLRQWQQSRRLTVCRLEYQTGDVQLSDRVQQLFETVLVSLCILARVLATFKKKVWYKSEADAYLAAEAARDLAIQVDYFPADQF